MKFPTHELAVRAQLAVEISLSALADQRLVPHFVEAYARSQGRMELLESAARYRELIQVLTREALLAISVRIASEARRRLISSRRDPVPEVESAQLDRFREEFFLQLAKVMRWTPEELEEFYNDVELCQMMALRQEASLKQRKQKSKPIKTGVTTAFFADRAALLLDPSFLEKARAAAAQFEPQLDATASKAAATAFRPLRK